MAEERSHRRIWAAVFLLLICSIVAGVVVLVWQTVERPEPVEIEIVAKPAAEIEVYLSGAVESEGIYFCDEDRTIGELLQVAGGVAGDAEAFRIRVDVLRHDESPYDASEEHTSGKVNINTAPLEVLMTLSGIGEVKAQAIIDFREENGPFVSVGLLTEVKGIGPKTVEKLQNDITVVD